VLPPDVEPIAVSKARIAQAAAERVEIELAQLKSSVVDVDQARKDVMDAYAIVRTRLLGVPSRLAQRLAVAPEIVHAVDEHIREALEDLAAAPAALEDAPR
jgi:hypothetical protein